MTATKKAKVPAKKPTASYKTDYKKHKKWPTLYKKASTGKDVEWNIHVDRINDCGGAVIVVTHGQVGGKMQTATQNVATGKNIGRANETTPFQQAVSEAEAKWLKQKDKGYAETVGGANMTLKPMLALKYEDEKDKVTFPAFLQPKLDGYRCLAHKETNTLVRLISRQGKEFGHWLNHIREELLRIMSVGETLDGELYVHGVPFQTVGSWIKKECPESKHVQYHIYDIVMVDAAFFQRTRTLLDRFFHFHGPEGTLKQVETRMVLSHEGVEAAHAEFVAAGYEGVMLRTDLCPYKQGYRSHNLLKVKAWADAEFEIVAVRAGKGKMENQAIFTCKMAESGAVFDVKPKGRDALREEYLKHPEKCLGKMLTVKYFALTDEEPKVPRFPSGVSIRDYDIQ